MVEVSVLASGSSGNCFFFESEEGCFLIDAGISYKQICQRLANLGKQILAVKGIFVTHEHTDHIRALPMLAKNLDIPFFMSYGTYSSLPFEIADERIRIIRGGTDISFGGCIIRPFGKCHDAAEPLSFSFSYGGKTASFITDAGCACKNIQNAVSQSHILVLESNHDLWMLDNGRYPSFLKQRIRGIQGHLSNYDAALVVLEHARPYLSHVLLSHLSLNNNTEDLAYSTFEHILGQRQDLAGVHIDMTYRQKEIPLIRI